jgi:hypothetical protein
MLCDAGTVAGLVWQAAVAAIGFALHAATVNLAQIHFTAVGRAGTVIIGTD